ncbi:hypothetical protein [Ornithinimicrobium murale]|uniref:hypothetical protein n=1 Tax=Ornithinimicrobium murale TaxID=1050153 RepID=UPI000E0DCFD6|nr:hypothetical protein [Ornithinimicrobium murale]
MSVPLLTPRERIGGARRLYQDRGGARTQGDTAYLAYLVVLVLAMVVIPLLIGTARVLAEPEILSALQSAGSRQVVLAVSGALLAAATVVGMHRGPAHLPPVLVSLLAGTDLPRSRTLLRPFVTAAVALTILFTVAGGLLATVLVLESGLDVPGALGLTGAAAALGVIAAAAWLAGQRVGPRHGWVLTVALLAATGLTLLVPALATVTPWGWVADLWPPTADGPPWALLPLVLVALVCAERVPRLLDRVLGPLLLRQARQWEIVSIAAYTGDLASALATFRALPRLGRRWWAVPGSTTVLQYAVRDLVGAARTPVRAVTGLAFLILGGALMSLAVAGTPVSPLVLAGLGAVAGFLALGTLTDGFRHAADTRSLPTLFGHTTAQLFLLHTLVPVLLAVLCSVAGAGLARLAGWPAAGLVEAALLGVLLVAVRAFDSTKGPLPLTLLTPAPSPVGDLSGLMVMAWQADALLLAIALGLGLAYVLTTGGLLLAAGAAVLALVAVVGLAYGRLNDL